MTPPHRLAVRLIGLVFFLQPIAFGNWLARIPEVRDRLGLSPSELAGALLGAPVGIVATLPFAGAVVARIGSRATILLGFAVFLPALGLPGIAPSGVSLFAALLIVGAVVSLLELGLNVEADRIEAMSGRLIMSTCHGFWSLGLMTGSLIGAGLAHLACPLAPSLFGVALVMLPLCLLAARALPDERAGPQPHASAFFRPSRMLVAVCAFVFGVALTEGAAADWSAIFLRDSFGLPNGTAAFAFAPFAASVALGRFCGDTLRRRFGRVAAARGSGIVALLGAVLIGVAPGPEIAVVGLALLGLGVSTGFPLAVTAAAGLDGHAPAANVAFLSMVALMGFLVGPPMIGWVAQHAGIQAGLTMVIPGLFLSFACAGALRDRTTAEVAEPSTSDGPLAIGPNS